MKGTVGIVILSWNGGQHTAACIQSARAQTYQPCFIVVVDNGSEPAELEQLRRLVAGLADVELQSLDRNSGYSEGNNIGMRRALERGAEWLLIATQDTVLDRDAVARLVAAGTAVPQAGIIGPLVVDADGCTALSRGERLSVPLLCFPRTLIRYRRARRGWYRVGGVLGCALLLSARCFAVTGGFDEGLFAYYEEVDLCLRARAAGFQILCAPEALVRHDGMRGFLGGFTPLSAELKVRNLWRVMCRHAKVWDWPLLFPTFVALLSVSFAMYLARGRIDIAFAMLRGLGAGLRREGGAARSLPRAR